MFTFRRFFCSSAPKFTTSLDWVTFPPNNFCLSGYLDGKKIAYATGDFQAAKDFRLMMIDVDSPHRSKGYGSKMIEQLISEATQLGCSDFVFVGVSVSNNRAAKLYRDRFNAVQKAIQNCSDKNDYVRPLA